MPKLLLVGWDAADWKVIHPLLDAGKMPVLGRLIRQGVMGNLSTINPMYSPMLWTSIATGMRPQKHGIHGFTEVDAELGTVRPITNLSRKVKAVWNILNQQGLRCNVIGWWPSHPAEPINGVMVSEHFHRAPADPKAEWRVRPGTVHPAALGREIHHLRIHPTELVAEQVLPFAPDAHGIDPNKDTHLRMLINTIAECSTVHACATAVMQLEPWDFMAIYYDAIDHFCHGFMKYHPPRRPHIPEDKYELYKSVVEGAYRFHDMMLGTLLTLAGEDVTVMLVSDHGFHPDELRPTAIPIEPAGPAAEHSRHGIIAMKGPGIRQDELLFGSNILDVAPTVLSLFDLPIGRDVDGKPLVEAFESEPSIRYIDSWETVDGDDGRHPPHLQMDAAESQAAMEQLIELGYVEAPNEDQAQAIRETTRELDYNLARAYTDAGQHVAALPLLESLWSQWPDESRFGAELSQCQLALGYYESARQTAEEVFASQARLAKHAQEELAKLDMEKIQEQFESLPRQEQTRLRRLNAHSRPNRFLRGFLLAPILLAQKKDQEALHVLRETLAAGPVPLSILLQHGRILIRLQQWHAAESAFRKVIETDSGNAQAHLGIAVTMLARRQFADAVEYALGAVGLRYFYPQAHYYLGIALDRTGHFREAVQALNLAIAQNPNYAEAHARLARVHRVRFSDDEKSDWHKSQFQAIRRSGVRSTPEPASPNAPRTASEATSDQEAISNAQSGGTAPVSTVSGDPIQVPAEEIVTIVSGLPRSGTSMMMQMLEAGGLECFSDGERAADESNPRGYFEHEKVKRLKTDSSWFPQARGKAVKVIAQLLPFLPHAPEIHYRVVFMDRDLDEIIDSQAAMLDRLGKGAASRDAQLVKNAFRKQLRQAREILRARQIPMLMVNHKDAIAAPEETARRVSEFCGDRLSVERMTSAVDPKLHRVIRTA